MTPYIILFLFLLMCHCVSNISFIKNKKWLYSLVAIWIPIIILILISTFKSNSVGNDTEGYYNEYLVAKTDSIDHLNRHLRNFEIGFRYLFIGFAKTGLPFRFFQFTIYSIVYCLLGVVLQKESKYPSLALILFALWSWMVFDFSALRQGVADMLGFFALFLISRNPRKINKKIVTYFASVLLLVAAFLFHKSSIVFSIVVAIMAIYSFFSKEFIKLSLVLVIVIPIVFLLSPELYQFVFYLLKMNEYIPTDKSDTGQLFLLYYLIFIFALLYGTKNVLSSRTNEISDKVYCKITKKENCLINNQIDESITLYTSMSLLTFGIGVGIESFSSVCYGALRISNPFLMAAIIVIPNVIHVNKSKPLRIAAQALVILVFVLTFYIDYYRPNYLHCFPLTFF